MPRDPSRIDGILTTLRDLWYEYPDQRLGQLVMNYADNSHGETLFFTEDDQIEQNLLKALLEARKGKPKEGTFKVGDIVDWKVVGGGGPGRVIGTLECEVIHTSLHGTELILRPISWEDAWEILQGEYEFQDFLEDYKHGGLENVEADHCTLVKTNNIEVKDHPDCLSINFKVKEESRALYRTVYAALSKNITVKDKLILEQIESQLKKVLTNVHTEADS